ncbi:MAG: hypothetical protein QGF46_05230, partial [Planctomycetota bacterium]|nr:hypothetical protein [Planctomycetota bacterium]
PLYVGDDLGDLRLSSELETHLDSCKLCEAEYESFAEARDVLLDFKDIDSLALDSMWSEIEGKLHNVELPQKGVPWLKIIGGLAAASVAMMLFINPLQQPLSEDLPDAIASTSVADIATPTDISPPPAARKMNQSEIAAFFSEQRAIQMAQVPESTIIPRANNAAPSASMVGFDYSTIREL